MTMEGLLSAQIANIGLYLLYIPGITFASGGALEVLDHRRTRHNGSR